MDRRDINLLGEFIPYLLGTEPVQAAIYIHLFCKLRLH